MEGDNSNHHHHHHHQDTYKECLRNHAASLGSYATDGCGEFTVDENTPDGGSLNCAACGCHRNFHRKVIISQSRGAHQGMNITMTTPINSTDYNNNRSSSSPMQMIYPPFEIMRSCNSNKKRFRTKFSDEQKEKMMRFAEKLGWRMLRKDEEDEIERFCRGIGISRKVFKVWMHNHKNNSNNSSSTMNDSSNGMSDNHNNSAASHGNASSLTDDVDQ